MERATLATTDGLAIAGDYYPGASPRGVLLIHMMPATKESWADFALRLAARGYHVLAIDLRGHGASSGGPDGYRNFSDAEHQKSALDLDAGVHFLSSKGAAPGGIALVGASIGANLALQYLAGHADVKTAVLLSAGTNYHGVETAPSAEKLSSGQRVLFATSEDDGLPAVAREAKAGRSSGNNADMNRALFGLVSEGAEKKLIVYTSAGHGTDMFRKEKPDLAEEILAWIESNPE